MTKGRVHGKNKDLQLYWPMVDTAVKIICDQLKGRKFQRIYAIERGGVIPASLIARRFPDTRLEIGPPGIIFNDSSNVLIVDDIWDTGDTMRRLISNNEHATFVCLTTKQPNNLHIYGLDLSGYGWITFPWEVNDR